VSSVKTSRGTARGEEGGGEREVIQGGRKERLAEVGKVVG